MVEVGEEDGEEGKRVGDRKASLVESRCLCMSAKLARC